MGIVAKPLRRLIAATISLLPAFALGDPSSTSPEQGWDMGDVLTPRTLAMAGAQAAFGTSTNAIYNNPANLPFSRVYHFEAMASFSPEARRQSYGGAIVDSTTSRLAGGIGGQWVQLDPDGIQRRAIDLRLALAFPFNDKIAIGVIGRYLRGEQAVAQGPFGRSRISDGTPGDPTVNGFTFDAGISVAPIPTVRFGVVGRNLTNPSTSYQPTNLLFGGGFGNETFTIEANGQVDFTTYGSAQLRVMGGAEYFLLNHVPLRLGYRYDNALKVHALSAGVGYVDTRFSVELGLRRDIIADNPSTVMGLSARFFYDGGANGSNAGGGGADGAAF